MRIESSLDQLAKLYQSAALGKLINGLIHNMNGPLQNLGIDMEMILHTLKEHEDRRQPEVYKYISDRLHRMEKEFDHINTMTRTTALRTDHDESWFSQISLGHYLEEELTFLNADLYFKHQVHKKIEIEGHLPVLSRLPKGLPRALSWFIQVFLEELAGQKINECALKVTIGPTGPQVILTAKGKELSRKFLDQLNLAIPLSGPLKVEDDQLELAIILSLLKTTGVELTTKITAQKSQITLTLQTIMV